MQRRDGGVLTGLVFGGWRVGDEVELEGPFGQCVLADGTGPVLMLATGTGLAPMLAMLEENLAAALPRPVTLYWGGRRMADLYMADELAALSRAHPEFRFVPVLSSTGSYVQERAAAAFADLSGVAVYACGAPSMVDAARQRLLALPGAAADRFFADAFEPAQAATESAADAPTIVVRPSGDRVRVALGGSLLSGLANAGVAIQSVCGGHASCGTCRVRLAPEWMDRLPPVGRAERRLLAVLREPGPAHRLACQIALQANHADLVFTLDP
jgi:CDP-4-dehydro-6-deoxyglucose reductase